MVVENITYPPLPASDYGNNGGSGIDLSIKRCHVAENLFVSADTDNEESVVTRKEKDPQYKQEEEQIILSINNKKSIQNKKCKGSPPVSITKSGMYFRAINIF
jgi:hypothetical protein